MSTYKDLHNKIKHVILSVGDIVVDNVGGHIGILIKRNRHIDIVEDDIYVWEVKWINNVVKEFYEESPMHTILEEEGLKLSIVVGTYEWHSVTGGTFEL
tara:strand:+ start:4678 stop:4974 length:297 start_codon:yes stop_codon:yes gene_type:complete